MSLNTKNAGAITNSRRAASRLPCRCCWPVDAKAKGSRRLCSECRVDCIIAAPGEQHVRRTREARYEEKD